MSTQTEQKPVLVVIFIALFLGGACWIGNALIGKPAHPAHKVPIWPLVKDPLAPPGTFLADGQWYVPGCGAYEQYVAHESTPDAPIRALPPYSVVIYASAEDCRALGYWDDRDGFFKSKGIEK
jgi:hypothetical protein